MPRRRSQGSKVLRSRSSATRVGSQAESGPRQGKPDDAPLQPSPLRSRSSARKSATPSNPDPVATLAKSTEPAVLNAFWQRSELCLVVADPAKPNGVRIRRSRAEHSTFIAKVDGDKVLSGSKAPLHEMLANSKSVRSSDLEGPWYRIKFFTRDDCKNICTELEKRGINTFEGLVSPVMRYMSDNNVPVATPRMCWIDLETDSRVSFARAEEHARILCYCIYDEHCKLVGRGLLEEDTDDAERRLLQQMVRTLDRYDLVAAWNGDRFDFPVIKRRLEQRKIKVEWRRWLWLDHMVLFQRMNVAAESGEEKQSFRLDSIANTLLGVGKHSFDASKTWQAYMTPDCADTTCMKCRACLVEYCGQDTVLMPMLEEKTGFIEVLLNLANACGTFPDTRGINPSIQVEGFLQRLALREGHKFPTVLKPALGERYEGAYVMVPTCTGITKNVHVADFSGLYPSVIITWNISNETRIKRGNPAEDTVELQAKSMSYSPLTKVNFDTSKPGILPTAVREMMRLRKYWNKLKATFPPGSPQWKDADRKSTAYKVAANSFYGVMGSTMSRFFDRKVAESVAQCAKWLILKAVQEANDMGMDVVYADTDSVFVEGASRAEFEVFVKHCNEVLWPRVLEEVGCKENLIDLAYEKEFERIIFGWDPKKARSTMKKYCNPPQAPIWMADMSFKELGDIVIGDEVVGWERGSAEAGTRRKLITSTVVEVHGHRAPVVEVEFESGRTLLCTADHRWASYPSRQSSSSEFVTAKLGRSLTHVVDVPLELPDDLMLEAAWLGGIFDGEGSLNGSGKGQICISQSPTKNPEVCTRIEDVLTKLGLPYSIYKMAGSTDGADGVNVYAIIGNDEVSPRQARLNFMTWCRPAKAPRIVPALLKAKFGVRDKVVSVEPHGGSEVIGLTTTTGNYVAWGYASKNCGRYAHYKGTKADPKTSKPEIKGFEFKRGDTTKFSRQMQEEVIELLVGYGPGGGCEDPDVIEDVLDKWKHRILHEPLALEDVVVGKRLKKPLHEYVRKMKKDGSGYASQLPHIEIAREMEARGEDVGEGVRIEYFVYDGGVSPMDTRAATEWDDPADPTDPNSPTMGEAMDRFVIWDKQVFPATERLIEGAFPGHCWKAWKKTRPPKVRKPRKVRGAT